MEHDLDDLLALYPEPFQPLRVESLGGAGGFSGAQFWRISTTQGEFVVRRWPREHPSRERLALIHAVLAFAGQRGMQILPIPVQGHGGNSFVSYAGYLWEVCPWLNGEANFYHQPSDEKLVAAMKSLATFHQATRDFLPQWSKVERIPPSWEPRTQSAVGDRLGRLAALTPAEICRLSERVTADTFPGLAPLARKFLTLVSKVSPAAKAGLAPLARLQCPRQPCIGDIWHDHVLFVGEQVTGLVDFGALRIDTPAVDVTRLLDSLVGGDLQKWQFGLDAYQAVRSLVPPERQAISALVPVGTILAGCNWIRWIYVEHRTFEPQHAVLDRFERLLARISQLATGGSHGLP
jgi:Ser/Thr protein kinase RdoA (MazF antagonist)